MNPNNQTNPTSGMSSNTTTVTQYRHIRTNSLFDSASIGLGRLKDKERERESTDKVYEVLNTEYVNDFHNKIKDRRDPNAISFNNSNNAPLLTEVFNSTYKKSNDKDNTYNNSIVNTEPNKAENIHSLKIGTSAEVTINNYLNKYIVKDQYDIYSKKVSKPTDIKKDILTLNSNNNNAQIKKNYFNTSMSFDHNVDIKNTTYENLTNNIIKGDIKKKL